MVQLHQDHQKFMDRNTIVVAIGPEDKKSFKKYWDEHEFEFYGIPDEKQYVLDMYDQKVSIFKLGRMPAQILVDKEGLLRFIHYGQSMKDISENEEILKIIDNL